MSWSLSATSRSVGCGNSRSDGNIPGVVYGGGKPALHVSMVLKDVVRLMQSEESYRFGKLVIDGKSLQCIVKELQCEPKTGLPIHVGFLNLHDAKRVTTFLAIKPTGTSSGVKRGGVLNLAVPELEVVVTNTALLDTLPDHIEVDISKVDIGGVFHLSDLQLPSGVVPANAARDNTILSVVAPAGIGNDSEGSSSDDASASSAA